MGGWEIKVLKFFSIVLRIGFLGENSLSDPKCRGWLTFPNPLAFSSTVRSKSELVSVWTQWQTTPSVDRRTAPWVGRGEIPYLVQFDLGQTITRIKCHSHLKWSCQNTIPRKSLQGRKNTIQYICQADQIDQTKTWVPSVLCHAQWRVVLS